MCGVSGFCLLNVLLGAEALSFLHLTHLSAKTSASHPLTCSPPCLSPAHLLTSLGISPAHLLTCLTSFRSGISLPAYTAGYKGVEGSRRTQKYVA